MRFAINLAEGNLCARFHQSIHEPPALLEAGRTYAYRIEHLPTSNVLRGGHRIRLKVSRSNFPLWDRNPHTAHAQGEDADLSVVHQPGTTAPHARHGSCCR